MDVRAFPGPSRWGIPSEDEDIQDEASAVQEGNRPSANEGKDIAGAASSLVELKMHERPDSDQKGIQCARSSENLGAIRASSGLLKTYRRRISDYQKLQHANNFCKAAYLELMRKAKEAGTWVRMTPALGNLDDIVSGFRTPAPPGKRLELSVATAVIPNISASDVATMMMKVSENWSKALLPFVHYGEGYKPIRSLQHLRNCDTAITSVVQVYAELQLPTTFAPRRYFDFLRYGKEIMKDVFVIVDVSSRYFSNLGLVCNSEKRPSGVIIREHGPKDCEIICVEHVEVDIETAENMYSSVTNSSLEFCAKRWISTLLSNLRRERSMFIDVKMDVHRSAGSYLLAVTHSMKNFFMECVSQHPEEALISVLTSTEDHIRILENLSLQNISLEEEFHAYEGVTSFRIQAKPLSVFQFLTKKNLQLLFRGLGNPEQLFRFVTDDNSNIISLHGKKMEEETIYYLQEASRDEYCSFITSGMLSDKEVNLHIVSESTFELSNGHWYFPTTSGFCIMPDGSGGLQCNGSLVTFVMQLWKYRTVDIARDNFVWEKNAIFRQLNEEVVGKND